jgi:hypothetical protein
MRGIQKNTRTILYLYKKIDQSKKRSNEMVNDRHFTDSRIAGRSTYNAVSAHHDQKAGTAFSVSTRPTDRLGASPRSRAST